MLGAYGNLKIPLKKANASIPILDTDYGGCWEVGLREAGILQAKQTIPVKTLSNGKFLWFNITAQKHILNVCCVFRKNTCNHAYHG